MDPLSQGLLGAALAASFCRDKKKVKAAAQCGALGGMAPDLDVAIRSSTDPLLFIEYHRHFTHSLAFVPIGGLIVALGLWYVLRFRSLGFKQLYIFTTIGLATHGVLDACTSYGTRLLWPFSDLRVSWNVVSIIDPIFTGMLCLFMALCLWQKSANAIRLGLCLSLAYLGLGFVQHKRVEAVVNQIAQERGHKVERMLLNPTIANNILWRTVYQSSGKYYVNAVHVAWFGEPKIFHGAQVNVIDKETVFPDLASDSVQREDLRRFAYFSQDFIYIHPDGEHMIADLRYGRMPYDNRSLWAITIDPATPNEHVAHSTLRDYKDEHFDEFQQMLYGDKE